MTSDGGNGADTQELPSGDNQEGAAELFTQPEVLKEGTKKNDKLKGALSTFFADTEGLDKLGVNISLTVEECDILADEVIKIVANAAEVF